MRDAVPTTSRNATALRSVISTASLRSVFTRFPYAVRDCTRSIDARRRQAESAHHRLNEVLGEKRCKAWAPEVAPTGFDVTGVFLRAHGRHEPRQIFVGPKGAPINEGVAVHIIG